MYKTIRHGENSLQYTILPQNENGLDGKQIMSRRSRKWALLIFISIFFIIIIIGGALAVSWQFLFHNPKWLANSNRMTMHMKERLYEAFYGKNYLETKNVLNQQQLLLQQQKNNTNDTNVNDNKMGNISPYTQFPNNYWSNSDISAVGPGTKYRTSSVEFPKSSAAVAPPFTTTTTTVIPVNGNNRLDLADIPPAWKSVVNIYDQQNGEKKIRNKVLTYTAHPTSQDYGDVQFFNHYKKDVKDRRNDGIRLPIMKPIKTGEFYRSTTSIPLPSSSSSSSSSSSVSPSTQLPLNAFSTISTPIILLNKPLVNATNIANDVKQSLNIDTNNGNKPWLKSYWPFVDSSTYFQWTNYESEDNILLPLIIGGSVLAVFVFATICIISRNRSSCCGRNRKNDVFSVAEGQNGDDATLLENNTTDEE